LSSIGQGHPAVSIVLCINNGHAHFRGITGYLERQPFKDYELLFVVTDTSDDGSKEDAANYCFEHPEASYIIQYDRSYLGGAKNIGLENSHGRYVWFLDVDDNPSDDFLSVMVDSLESSESQVAVCNFIYSKEEKGPDGERKGSDIVLTGRQAMHARSLNLIPVASWSMLYDLRTVMDNGIRFP